jgi:hypothetical protein
MIDWDNLPWERCNNVELSKFTGAPTSTVRIHRPKDIPCPGRYSWAVRNRDLMGVLPDREVAEIVKRSERQVWEVRNKWGIPPCHPSSKVVGPRKPLLPEHEVLLGTMNDRDLAKLSGVSHTTIYNRRTKLGIPPVNIRKMSKKKRKELLKERYASRHQLGRTADERSRLPDLR